MDTLATHEAGHQTPNTGWQKALEITIQVAAILISISLIIKQSGVGLELPWTSILWRRSTFNCGGRTVIGYSNILIFRILGESPPV
jgi:hypothetical protein